MSLRLRHRSRKNRCGDAGESRGGERARGERAKSVSVEYEIGLSANYTGKKYP